MVRTKVFVGNLDFQTKEAELVQQFGAAGKVISANIITRGPRSLGYGFVEMDSEEDAAKAVQLLNKKEIDGRPVNVEVAKPRDETKAKEANANTNSTDEGARRGSSRGRGGRGGRSRGGRGRGGRGFSRGTSSFRPRTEGAPRENQQNTTGAPVSPKQPRERQEENRTPSKTMLFVANLPFKLDDDTFAKVFKDASLNYKSAHVVKNQRSGRSKGFGFVEFDNEADQQKALNTINKKVVDERELIVKVALTENKAPEQTANKQ
jgi:RNA recognition motif-containing protein